jgi:hypothetical protein
MLSQDQACRTTDRKVTWQRCIQTGIQIGKLVSRWASRHGDQKTWHEGMKRWHKGGICSINTLTTGGDALIYICRMPKSVLRIRDPVPFWPLDPGWVKDQDPDPGSGMNILDHISDSLEAIFWVKSSLMWIRNRDPKSFWPWIRDKHPGSATLAKIFHRRHHRNQRCAT